MAPRPESIGTEGNKRSSDNQTRKKFPLKPNFYITTLVLFFILLGVKVILSGFFLNTSPLSIAATGVAMAQETPKENAPPAVTPMDQNLRQREQALLQKEEELKKMQVELLPLREEIDTRMAELNELQNSLTAKAKTLAEKEKVIQDTKIAHLVKLYSTMEAKKAADILDRLQIDTVVRILGNMKGKEAGGIMAMLPLEKGAIISEKLSESER
jgi:flagellar motility protein MotE (MotC chaperone)